MTNLGYELSEKYEISQNIKHKVYTPKEISTYILSETFKSYFLDKDIKVELSKLSLVDISCGSGNFLVEALNWLLEKHMEIFNEYKFYSCWINGYDIDKEAIKICQQRIKEILESKGISNYELNINPIDSLLNDIGYNYDIVIGNPPYIGEKSNKEVFQAIRETDFGKKYYEAKMDYFYFFIEKGLDILKNNGILTYITTNYWLKADSASKLRDKIKKDSDFIFIDDMNCSVFKRALGQHNLIFSLLKNKNNKKSKLKIDGKEFYVSNSKLYNENEKIVLAPEDKIDFFNSISKKRSFLLGDKFNINQGIVSGYDKAFIFDEYLEEFSKYLKPFYKNSDINNYKVNDNKYWILYLSKDINFNHTENKAILKHLESYKGRLEKRREVENNFINWYNLQWARKESIFKSKKIVARQRARKNLFAYSDKDLYGSADIYYLTLKDNSLSLYFILAYLNSEFFFNWFYFQGKRKGENLELYSTPLKEVPVYYPNDKNKILYIENLVKKQIESYSDEIQNKINEFFRGEI